MAVQLIFYFFYVILDNFKLKKQYVKLKLVLTVLINLTQLIKTMPDICNIPLNSKQTSVSVEHVKEELVTKGKMVLLDIIL